MKIGWLVDDSSYVGGAELTQAEFRAAAPDGVEIVDCPAGHVVPGLDRYVAHNVVGYTPGDIRAMGGRTVVKYHHDMWPHGDPEVRQHLLLHAKHVFCSPLQRQKWGWSFGDSPWIGPDIPPPVDLGRFRASQNGHKRSGAVSVAAWMNYGKAPHLVAEWAQENGGVDFYGGGALAPPGSSHVDYEDMPKLFGQYETFVFLPTAVEPFGRTVVEAWAAGCKIVTNELVGARHWIENDPDALETAAEDFWELVLA